jgi:hypothetical protein
MKTANILKNNDFTKLGKRSVRPDSRKRIVLPVSMDEGVSFDVYRNKAGQIILDPKIEIPASQAWFWENPHNIKDFEESIAQAARGELTKVDLQDL